jgi:hypothetical protein
MLVMLCLSLAACGGACSSLDLQERG